jgi:hypothetical protein
MDGCRDDDDVRDGVRDVDGDGRPPPREISAAAPGGGASTKTNPSGSPPLCRGDWDVVVVAVDAVVVVVVVGGC